MDPLGRDERLLATLEQLLKIETLELRPVLDRISSLLGETLGADKVDVFLFEESSHTLVAEGTSETPMGRLQQELGLDRLPVVNGGRVVEVHQTGSPFLTGRAEEDPCELKGIIEGLGVRSELLCPIHVDSVRRGVLSVVSARKDCFSDSDLRFLEAVAGWIGVIIHRAELIRLVERDAVQRGRRAAADELALLTRRQQEIAALIAEGLTSEEIAERLVVVTGTVYNHVEHILAKLNLRNRAQIAAWAVERGLYRSDQDKPEQ